MLSHWKTLVIKRLSGLIKLKGFSMNCIYYSSGKTGAHFISLLKESIDNCGDILIDIFYFSFQFVFVCDFCFCHIVSCCP